MSHDLLRLKAEIREMRRSVQSGRQKPHKLIMLLAALDLAEDGLLAGNRVYYDAELIARFKRRFAAFADATDWCQPAPPFFHMRTSPFWLHRVRPGREAAYEALRNPGGSPGPWKALIEYAYLSDYAYRVVRQPTQRRELQRYILGLLRTPKARRTAG